MNVNLYLPIQQHIPPVQLTGIEKLEFISKGEGKYIVEMLWHGRRVGLEVYLKNKQLKEVQARRVIADNLKNVFANVVSCSEWNPSDLRIYLIWNEHSNEMALMTNNSMNHYIYRKMDNELKDRFKAQLKHTLRERDKLLLQERSAAQEKVPIIRQHLEEMDQRIMRMRMAIDYEIDKEPRRKSM